MATCHHQHLRVLHEAQVFFYFNLHASGPLGNELGHSSFGAGKHHHHLVLEVVEPRSNLGRSNLDTVRYVAGRGSATSHQTIDAQDDVLRAY
jgi:hypothetical protein